MKSSIKFIKKLLLIAALLTGLPTKPTKINLNDYEREAIFLSAGIFITGWYCINKYFSKKQTLPVKSPINKKTPVQPKEIKDNLIAPITIASIIDETDTTINQPFSKTLSPTHLHLMYVIAHKNKKPDHKCYGGYTYYPKNPNVILANILKDQTIKKLTEKAFSKELASAKDDHFILYHGTQPKYYAAHHIDTALLRLKEELKNNNACYTKVISSGY